MIWTVGLMLAGRYRLDAALGTSNPASVWAATHLPSGRRVAIRRLPSAELPRPALAAVVAELHDAVTVDHPNVARVYEVLDGAAEAPLLVTELLRGETLAQKLARQPLLSPGETASLLLPVVSAVGTAHARGIVHGRLSPSCIFCHTESSGTHTVKLLDFGVGKWAAAATQAPQSVRGGALAVRRGSGYAPPEQALPGRTIDHRADTWALGVILYECLSGLAAEVFVPPAEPLTAIPEAFTPIEQHTPSLPSALADIVAHLLVSDPDHRAQNVIELFRVLSPLADRPSPTFGWPGSERRISGLTQRAVSLPPPPPSVVPVAPLAPVILPAPRPTNWRAVAMATSVLAAVELGMLGWSFVRSQRPAPRVLQAAEAQARGAEPPQAETLSLQAGAAPGLSLDDFEDGDGVPLAPVFGNWQSFTVNPAGRGLDLKLGAGYQSRGSVELSFFLEHLAEARSGRAGAGFRTTAKAGSVDLSRYAQVSFAHRHAPMSTPGFECRRAPDFVVFVTCRALSPDHVPQFELRVPVSEQWSRASVALYDLREVGTPHAINLKACLSAADSLGFRADAAPNAEPGGCDSGTLWVDEISFQ